MYKTAILDRGLDLLPLRLARRSGAQGSGRHCPPPRHAADDRADHLAENLCLFALIAATSGKIAREIYTLMKTEFGEVEEPVPPGTVGSSTMPQKRNPKLCQDIIAAAADVWSCVPPSCRPPTRGSRPISARARSRPCSRPRRRRRDRGRPLRRWG